MFRSFFARTFSSRLKNAWKRGLFAFCGAYFLSKEQLRANFIALSNDEELSSHVLFEKVKDSVFSVVDEKDRPLAIAVFLNGFVAAYFANSEHIEALKNKRIEAFATSLNKHENTQKVSLHLIAVKEDENLALFAPQPNQKQLIAVSLSKQPKLVQRLLAFSVDENSSLGLSDNFICDLEKVSELVDFPVARLCKPSQGRRAFEAGFDLAGKFAGFFIPDSSLLIPSQHTLALIESFRQTQKFERAFLGISMMSTTTELKEKGMLVTNVLNSSPAAAAGLKMGDVILQVNGWQTHSAEEVYRALGYQRERILRLLVRSRGEVREVEVRI